ncbi:hypothetical protein [Pseudonocardia sp. KRD291]|uniref:hypothetical protein n=1 Tax=Pseudonocardia sp. KRD291 TaxID=2792007 RepID=UPI001C4A1A49|nr:hypothetical protein [Pseudonocardia sp. KRD291]MBW0101731.1 hypothetical protein [Pseudonocardia sp. KRD291]
MAGRTTARVGGFAAALALVFAGGWALGGTLGPVVGGSGAATAVVDASRAVGPGHGTGTPHASPGGSPAAAPDPETEPAGLSSTRSGYTLVADGTVLDWKQPTEIAFTITGSDGAPVRAFDGAPGAQIDAAVIRRDDAGYTQLRATQGPDGVWRAPVEFPGAGVWRLYAGFTPTGGPALDLGTDLFVPGPFGPFTFTGEQRTVQTGEYQVRLDGGLLAGGESRVFATVSKDGAPVTDLAPVEGTGGAFGRMVAVRQGDLARFPLRPETTGSGPDARSGPGVAFVADVPSPGSHRLFLTFTHDGAEHLCEFTVGTPTGS